jgi:hypothetical protein
LTTEPIVLFRLDVIHVGLAMRALQVRLPSGEEIYLQVPNSESEKFQNAMRALKEEWAAPAKETRFDKILKD